MFHKADIDNKSGGYAVCLEPYFLPMLHLLNKFYELIIFCPFKEEVGREIIGALE